MPILPILQGVESIEGASACVPKRYEVEFTWVCEHKAWPHSHLEISRSSSTLPWGTTPNPHKVADSKPSVRGIETRQVFLTSKSTVEPPELLSLSFDTCSHAWFDIHNDLRMVPVAAGRVAEAADREGKSSRHSTLPASNLQSYPETVTNTILFNPSAS